MANFNRSYPEIVVATYISKIYHDALFSYRGFPWNTGENGGLSEIDIYIPSLNFGIEYDGQMYHDEYKLEHDLRKNRLCAEHGIKLLRIREEKCPEISGDVLRTTHNYTIQSFTDLFEDLRHYLNVNYDANLSYTSASDVYKIMVEAREEYMKNKNQIDSFVEEAKDYLSLNDTDTIPTNAKYEKNGRITSVGSHLSKIRQSYKNNELTQTEIDKILDVYPMCFMTAAEIEKTRYDNSWNKMLAIYQNYISKFGVSTTISNNDEKLEELYEWQMSTKQMIANKSLEKEKLDALLRINPHFGETNNKIIFDENLALYKDYLKNHNQDELTVNTIYNGKKLGSWVLSQKSSLKEKYAKREKGEKIDDFSLYKINAFTKTISEDFFTPHKENLWNINFANYADYLNGKTFSDDKVKQIKKWAAHQKENFVSGKLTERDDKYKKLISVNPNFFERKMNQVNDQWESLFSKYKEYCKENHTYLIPNEEKELYSFVSDQQHMKVKLDKGEKSYTDVYKERFAKLLSFNPDFFATNAELKSKEWINLYKQYIHEKGTLYISSTDEYKGQKLGSRITKDMSNFANKKDKFNPDSPYYLPEIEKEYLALIPNFSVENTYGVIEPPTSEQKYLLSCLGKSEDDAPTKQYADYCLHKHDEQRTNAGQESIFKQLSSYTPPINQTVIPSMDEINDFCKKAQDTVNTSFTKYIRSVPHGISKMQLAMAGNSIHIEEENNQFVIKDNTNPLLSVPIINIDADKKEWGKVPDNLASNIYSSVYESLDSVLPAITDGYDKVHHILVDILHTDADKLDREAFDNICKKHECTTFANRKYRNAKELVEDVAKTREDLSKSKSDLQKVLTELRVTQKISDIKTNTPVKTQSIKLK